MRGSHVVWQCCGSFGYRIAVHRVYIDWKETRHIIIMVEKNDVLELEKDERVKGGAFSVGLKIAGSAVCGNTWNQE